MIAAPFNHITKFSEEEMQINEIRIQSALFLTVQLLPLVCHNWLFVCITDRIHACTDGVLLQQIYICFFFRKDVISLTG